jgi:hypothetical protein
MKTPREILLARHQAVAPKLDAIRKGTLSAMRERQVANQAAPRIGLKDGFPPLLPWLLVPWCELILPSRRVWTSLAVVWAVILVVNVVQRDPDSRVHGSTAAAPAMMANWREEQRWMNELLADRMTPPEADRPVTTAPRPRTQRYGPTAA